MITLKDILRAEGIEAKNVLVLRHRPPEVQLRRTLPRLASERHDLFNAYQQTQSKRVQKQMQRASHVAAIIGLATGKAVFVGIYKVGKTNALTREQYWQVREHLELRDSFGMKGFVPENDSRNSILWFDLALTKSCESLKGKLIVSWPPPAIAWTRWANDSEMPVFAIREESAFDGVMPAWNEIELSWADLKLLPNSWHERLREWKGIYYIFDVSDGKGYVGSAYGTENLGQRWQTYASTGHGGNALLRERDHRNFQFSVLQRVSPDLDPDEVIRLENTWKKRLHTRHPLGLNDN